LETLREHVRRKHGSNLLHLKFGPFSIVCVSILGCAWVFCSGLILDVNDPLYARNVESGLTEENLQTNEISENDHFPKRAALICLLMYALIQIFLLFRTTQRDAFSAKMQWALETIAQKEDRQVTILLNSLLPSTAVKRLVDESGEVNVVRSNVFVLFADMKGFTAMASKRDAKETLELLHEIYCQFDELVQSSKKLYKMDTIGDAYIIVGNFDSRRRGDAARCAETIVNVGLKMVAKLEAFALRKHLDLQLRVGIDIGRVVEGIIGEIQPRYHIYGKTLADANKLEASCTPGRILISDKVAQYVKDIFILEAQIDEIRDLGEVAVGLEQGTDVLTPKAKARLENFASGSSNINVESTNSKRRPSFVPISVLKEESIHGASSTSRRASTDEGAAPDTFNYFIVGRKDVDDVVDLLQTAVRNWEEHNRRIIRANCALQKSFLGERKRTSALKEQYESLLGRVETLESATDNPFIDDRSQNKKGRRGSKPEVVASFVMGFEDLYDESENPRSSLTLTDGWKHRSQHSVPEEDDE